MLIVHCRFIAAIGLFALAGSSIAMVVPLNRTNPHPLLPEPFFNKSTPLNGKSDSPHFFLSHSGSPAPALIPQSNAPAIAPAPTNKHKSPNQLPPTMNGTRVPSLQAPSRRPHRAPTKTKTKSSPKLKPHHPARSNPADEIKGDTDVEMLMTKRGYPITRWRRSKVLKRATTDDINIMAGKGGDILTIHGNEKYDGKPERKDNETKVKTEPVATI